MDWTDLAQDMYRWRDLVNAVMNLRIAQSGGESDQLRTGQLLKKDSAPRCKL